MKHTIKWMLAAMVLSIVLMAEAEDLITFPTTKPRIIVQIDYVEQRDAEFVHPVKYYFYLKKENGEVKNIAFEQQPADTLSRADFPAAAGDTLTCWATVADIVTDQESGPSPTIKVCFYDTTAPPVEPPIIPPDTTHPPIHPTGTILEEYAMLPTTIKTDGWVHNDTGPWSLDEWGNFALWGWNGGVPGICKIYKELPLGGHYVTTINAAAWPAGGAGKVWMEIDGDKRYFDLLASQFTLCTVAYNLVPGNHMVSFWTSGQNFINAKIWIRRAVPPSIPTLRFSVP